MPDKPQQPSAKKPLVIPKTDVSQDNDKSTRRFVYYMIALIALIVIAGGVLVYWLAGNFVTQTNKNKAQDKTIALLEQKSSTSLSYYLTMMLSLPPPTMADRKKMPFSRPYPTMTASRS